MYLTDETKRILEKNIGTSLSRVSEMDFDEEKKYVEEKTQRPLVFPKRADKRRTGRGNPLIVRRRICTMEEINKKIEEL